MPRRSSPESLVGISLCCADYIRSCLTDVLEASQANLDRLKVPSALTMYPFAENIPNTVRGAIALTHRLGIRCLWDEQLCVVQDDLLRKVLQLEKVAAMYENAHMIEWRQMDRM
ncbi:uncharacterized protein BCR38DRAFT_405952 [Pseudomassariella vexata]|uniref:Heterokaryon incompatibility domain-containing protein n=1 Tax=Pseudomassariella vexata TaxID=1141098 RepID=A0A1Y2EGF0_9PEZI|nr:uncharacterized protein BCR38DRAFT_405952 [Pseudomassariella vexata]ORY70336.1 hypothetical protein BCR38DRAFT_405952 [Pseudomassariella vexata]